MERKAQARDDFASSIELRFRIGGRIIISKLEETVAGYEPRVEERISARMPITISTCTEQVRVTRCER